MPKRLETHEPTDLPGNKADWYREVVDQEAIDPVSIIQNILADTFEGRQAAKTAVAMVRATEGVAGVEKLIAAIATNAQRVVKLGDTAMDSIGPDIPEKLAAGVAGSRYGESELIRAFVDEQRGALEAHQPPIGPADPPAETHIQVDLPSEAAIGDDEREPDVSLESTISPSPPRSSHE
jgi:hypothetical protein